MINQYLLHLMELCSDESFGQEAVEWAVLNGRVPLTYNLQADLKAIVGQPNEPDTGIYDTLCAEYRQVCRQNEAVLVQSYEQSGLLEEILHAKAA